MAVAMLPGRTPSVSPRPAAAPATERWTCWGTYAFIGVSHGGRLAEAVSTARDLLDEVDRACSRFRDDSDLVAANRRPGRWTFVSPVLAEATRAAVAAAERTGGLVDPCLGRSLVSLGYDRDLRELSRQSAAPARATSRPEAWREIRVIDDAVRVPEGVALDLGATAKAWAADLVAETLAARLDCTIVVSLGGDVRVAGTVHGEGGGEPAPSWPVQVAEHPDDADTGPVVQLVGGLATSSTLVRRWPTLDGEQHHLLDPRTGAPVAGAYRTVTAAGGSCLSANTASTAAVVLGAAAPAWLADHGVAARLVGTDGTVTTVGDWPEERTAGGEAT